MPRVKQDEGSASINIGIIIPAATFSS